MTCSACYAFCACRKSATKSASRTPCCAFCTLCALCVCCLRCARAACNEATRAARIVPRGALPDGNVPSVEDGRINGQWTIDETGVFQHRCPLGDRRARLLSPRVVWLHESCFATHIRHVCVPLVDAHHTTVPMLLALTVLQQPIYCEQWHLLHVQL